MAYSINGIGTKFYGKRDFRSDSTYLTTEWITFLYIPLVPLRSLRVYLWGEKTGFFLGPTSTKSYQVHEKTRPDLGQVLSVYAFTVLAAVWEIALVGFVTDTQNATLAFSTLFLGMGLPAPIPWILRHYARQKLRDSGRGP